jgi:hypothetical protein
MNNDNKLNKSNILNRLVKFSLSINYFKMPRFIKSNIIFFRALLNKIAYTTNFFDKKPSKWIVNFSENEHNSMNQDQLKSCAILLHTCDKYEFLWKWFHYFFTKFRWTNNALKKYFLSENISTYFSWWQSICSWSWEWNQRLLKWLESIPEEYILYIQEDFWFLKIIDYTILQSLIDCCIQYDLPMLKIHDNLDDRYQLETTNIEIYWKAIKRVNKNSEYIISHAISIWKKEYLQEILNWAKNENPRDNELKWTFRIKFAKNKQLQIYQYDYFSRISENDEYCISSYREVCSRGKYNWNIKECIDQLLSNVN